MAHLNAGKIKKKSEATGNSQVATKPDQVIKEDATKSLNLPLLEKVLLVLLFTAFQLLMLNPSFVQGKLATEASSEQLEVG
ncbi:hypothetical protein ACLOJK_038395 [Asimina triloba]